METLRLLRTGIRFSGSWKEFRTTIVFECRLCTVFTSMKRQFDWGKCVDPEDVGVLEAKDYPELTLITCYPFHYIGSAPNRFIVHARRVSAVTE